MRQAKNENAAGEAARLVLYAGVRPAPPAAHRKDRLRRHWHSRSAGHDCAASGGRN